MTISVKNKQPAMPSNLVALPFKKKEVVKIDTTPEPERTAVTEFPFFLNAWLYCHQHNIPITQIVRKNWTMWHLVEQN